MARPKPKARSIDDLPRFEPDDRAGWRAWLAEHHVTATGVWLVTLRKAAGGPQLSYDDAVEEALCFGWIDSLPRKLDDRRTMLLFTPRKPGSPWAGTNKERVERLTRAGLMTPAGLTPIEAARGDGSWDLLTDAEALIVPPDLDAALADAPPARDNFLAFSPSVRKGILGWLALAKRPGTRAARIAKIARMAQVNLRANYDPEPPATA